MIHAPVEIGTPALLGAYRQGYFPMPVRRRIAWFSPNPRGIFLPGNFRITRSLRRSSRHYEVRVNTDFAGVIAACGDPSRPHGWITRSIIEAYTNLHHEGYAHSVEAWDDQGLAGGLYGLSLGGLFAAESMFHRRTDAGKVALLGLDAIMQTVPGSIIDTQWTTEHLVSLGAFDIARSNYATLLANSLILPSPLPFHREALAIAEPKAPS